MPQPVCRADVITTAALWLGLGAIPCAAGPHEQLGVLDHDLLPEASGLVMSLRTPDRLWFINDQGNKPALIGLDLDGLVYTRVKVEGARNRDWEDLAIFEHEGQSWLAIADVGDNLARRDHVAVHFVPEPAPGDKSAKSTLTLTLTYPGGARDAEAMAVDVATKTIYILSKRDAPPQLYEVRLPDLTQTGEVTDKAKLLGTVTSIPAPTALEIRLFPKYGKYRNQPTAMALAPDGETVALMTYGEAYLTRLDDRRDWLRALNQPLCALGAPLLAQPETIAVDAEGQVFVTSEREQAPLLRFDPGCVGAASNSAGGE